MKVHLSIMALYLFDTCRINLHNGTPNKQYYITGESTSWYTELARLWTRTLVHRVDLGTQSYNSVKVHLGTPKAIVCVCL